MARETYFQWPYSLEYAVANGPPVLPINLLRYSEAFGTAGVWTATRSIVVSNAAVAPDGLSTADRLIEDDTATSTHRVWQMRADRLTVGDSYCFSCHVKKASRSWIALGVYDGTAERLAWFDLTNGVAGTKGDGITESGIEEADEGYLRCYAVFTAGSSTALGAVYIAATDGVVILSGNPTTYPMGVLVWGAQMEPGLYPSPYTKTTTLFDAYPTAITVPYRPGMRLDFRDLRARDPATLEANDLFCEDYVSGVSAEVALALHPGQARVEVLYGNGAAESVSDGEAVYPDFFDPFDGSSLDGAAWNSGGQVAVSGGIATVRSSSASYISSKTAIPLGYAVRARANLGNGTNWIGLEATAGDTNSNNLDEVGTTYVRYGNGSTYGETAHSLTLSAAYHTLDIARYPGHTRFAVDGTVKWDETTILSTAARYPVVHGYSVPTLVDWIAVRPCSAVEPTLSYLGADCNPWSPLVNRPSALFDVPFDWSDFDAVKERALVSYTVRRSASDVMYSADVTFHDLIPQGVNFTRVKLIEPDHNGVDRLIFFGFLPAQTSTIQAAKNSTNYKGWDYGYYIASAYPPISWCTMPSTTASPGQWIYDRMSYPTHWTDIADPSRDLFDLTNVDVDAPAAWGTDALPARDIVCPTTSSHMAVYQAIAAKLGCIFYTRWIDVGKTPTIGHQDPAYRIVRKEAADYDAGGEGVGYHDTTAANLGGAYRKDGVDIEYFASEAGYNVGWIRDGEWLQYTVNFPAVDTYVARFRTASAAATGARSFKVYLDGALVDTISVDGTGSYSAFAWNTDTCDIVIGTAGNHTIKLLFDNAGDDVSDLLHMNLAAMEFTPTPPDDGTVPPTIVPALYWCDEADLDTALGLPIIEILPYDPTLAGAVKYAEDMSDVANAVSVRYHLGTGATPDEILETTDWIADRNGLEHWIEHVETVETPITTAQAVVLRDALLAYFAEDWGTVTANFTRRPDLQLFQRLWFRGHAQIPEYEADGTTPVLFRIVDISYSVGLAKCDVAITAVPVRKFAIEKQIARTRAPDPATEIEAIARSVLKSLPPALTGTVNTPGASSMTVDLDRGGTITARGIASAGDRVLCVYAEGIGYVASVIAAAT